MSLKIQTHTRLLKIELEQIKHTAEEFVFEDIVYDIVN